MKKFDKFILLLPIIIFALCGLSLFVCSLVFRCYILIVPSLIILFFILCVYFLYDDGAL